MSYEFRGRKAGRVESLNDYKAFGDDVDFNVTQNEATVVTSRHNGGIFQIEEMHLPVLDLDFPIVAEPSTTAGHFHLYIDRPMPWADLVKLLDVMAEVGLLEDGYVEAAKIRGYTSARLPWVKKPPRCEHRWAPTEEPRGLACDKCGRLFEPEMVRGLQA